MDRICKTIVGFVMVTTVAACGQSARKHDVVSDENAQVTGSEATSTATAGAFDPVERKMGEQMMTAVGADPGDNWVRKMIAHHQGAVDMSKVVLDQKPTAETAKMAQMTIEKQGHEIQDLTKLEEKGQANQTSADIYKPAMMAMQRAMMGAQGSTISDTYLRKMLVHHQGAIAMSDIALKSGVSGAVREQVQKTRADQQKEVDAVKSMIEKSSN